MIFNGRSVSIALRHHRLWSSLSAKLRISLITLWKILFLQRNVNSNRFKLEISEKSEWYAPWEQSTHGLVEHRSSGWVCEEWPPVLWRQNGTAAAARLSDALLSHSKPNTNKRKIIDILLPNKGTTRQWHPQSGWIIMERRFWWIGQSTKKEI